MNRILVRIFRGCTLAVVFGISSSLAQTKPLAPNASSLASQLQLWLKADSLTLTNGDPVAVWPDSSGHGRDFSPTRGARPDGAGAAPTFISESSINKRIAVHFAAESGLASSPDNRVEISGDAAFTMLLVLRLFENESSPGPGILFGFGDPTAKSDPSRPRAAFLQINRGAETTLRLGGGWNHDAAPPPGTPEPLQDRSTIVTITKSPGSFRGTTRFYLNGSLAGESLAGSDAVPDFAHRSDIGAFMGHVQNWAGGFAGDVVEVILYNAALSDADREGVELYLAGKYALTVPSMLKPPALKVSPEQKSWWAFQAVKKTSLPAVKNSSWIRSPIDAFVLTKLEARGLRPAPTADKRTLLRRLHFDLTGLPPTPQELREFQADSSPFAFSNAVERLLASPRYGERWGRHWMDVVRYADTAGDNADYPVPEARLYRDYIIDAFNMDKPYAQFIREQLAGDILARDASGEQRAERIVATGFLALSRRYATAPFEFMHLTIEDAIETTGRTFLGMTFRCARCHDHKYDPVAKEDYYSLYGVFASTRFPYAGSEEFASKNFPRTGFVPLASSADWTDKDLENHRLVAALRAVMVPLEKQLEAAKTNAELKKTVEAQLKPLRVELKRRDKFGAPPDVPVAYAVTEDKPWNEFIHVRGEPADQGVLTSRRAPGFLGVHGELNIPDGASGRLQLAEWIASEANPLTARVMVNRIWQHHFGKGLVHTPSNFGLRSEPPTHPELLDFLADYFVEHNWSVKAMHRLILNSATWQQTSLCATEPRDPANDLLWRMDRRRLDAESIRDTMMFAAGTLNLERPGPHPFPKFEEWAWTQHNHFKAVYDSDRRSVYLMRQRIQRHPYLALFDAPDANVSTDTRTDSIVPLQALYLMNNPFVETQAAALARRVIGAAADNSERTRLACKLAWSRDPSPSEINKASEFLSRMHDELARTGMQPDSLDEAGWTSYARVLLTANEFFYID
ncbi:MAG: DUF1553 domain-containing protein [Verrucomicrobia bacterium]|nr:DUF1553 domain-containing protein [Verrucomicrobiota bacterium]